MVLPSQGSQSREGDDYKSQNGAKRGGRKSVPGRGKSLGKGPEAGRSHRQGGQVGVSSPVSS